MTAETKQVKPSRGRPAKLSKEDLQTILKRYSKGESLRSLAKEFNVSHQAISKRLWPNGRTEDLTKTDPENGTVQRGLEIPVMVPIRGDRIRGVYEILTGKSHRGSIQACLDDLIAFLQRVEPLKPVYRRS